MADLDEIRAAIAEATPGPWRVSDKTPVVVVIPRGGANNHDWQFDSGDRAGFTRNAHLIAQAPTWLAELCDEVEQLREALRGMLAENERLVSALRRVAALGMSPRPPGGSYEIASRALMGVRTPQKDDWRGRMANDEAEFGTGRSQNLRTVIRDGEPQWQLRCPGCGVWADIDDDQLHGRVSVEHTAGSDDHGYAGPTGCGYHESRDWFTEELSRG